EARLVVFAEGEEEQVVRAANAFAISGLGVPLLVGREDQVLDTARSQGIELDARVEIHNARMSNRNAQYADFLYKRLQRRGFLLRDCQRLVNTDRNVFAACMMAMDDADAMVSGVTRSFSDVLEDVRKVIDPKPNTRVIGVSVILGQGRTVFVADTAVNQSPNAEDLARIAEEAAAVARRFGYEPRVAFLSFSSFGSPRGEQAAHVRHAVRLLDDRQVDFEYDGEMDASIALSPETRSTYPFCRLTDNANVLVMPAFHSARISTTMVEELGGATVLGPLVVGLTKPVQIAPLRATTSDLVNRAAIAAFDIGS
ncbi:MAG: phosphate acyltransferase, partial [Hyphomicrobiales bacterium]